MSSIDQKDEASEIDIFLYGRSKSPEELLLGLLNGDNEVINYGRLSFDEKIKAALIRYMQECDQNPERVVFYATKIMADGTMSIADAWSIFKSVGYLFPPILALLNLDQNDCKKLIKLFPTPELFKRFFDEHIIPHEDIQEEIYHVISNRRGTSERQLNWSKYYEPRQKVQKTLLH